MTSATAFSIDLRVMMSRGLRFFFTASTSTRADSAALSAFSASGEAICEEPSRLMPSASNDELMVLAVYCPPQAPTLGQAFFSMPSMTVGKPNTCGLAPADSSAAMARSTSGWMPALQGFMVEWPLATPTMGLSKSPSLNPTARSIARLGERATPWVIRRERRLAADFGSAIGFLLGGGSLSHRSVAIQYNGSRSLIPFGHEYAGAAPAAPVRGRRRAAALRPRGAGAAHLAAAAVALDPGPGAAP